MIQLFKVDFIFCLSHHRKDEWHALIASIGAHANIDLSVSIAEQNDC